MRARFLLAAALSLIFLSSPLRAAEFHGSAGLQVHRVDIADNSFEGRAFSGMIGWWLEPGISLETSLSIPLSSESVNGVALDMENLLTLGIRFESRPTLNGLSAHFLGGTAMARISAEGANGESAGSQNYTGLFLGFGLSQRINKTLIIGANFMHHAVDDSVTIPSAQLSLRHFF